MHFWIAYTEGGVIHTRVRIFAGPDEEHRRLAGTLTFRKEEFEAFRSLWGQKYTMLNEDGEVG